jgi:hypothetical protein
VKCSHVELPGGSRAIVCGSKRYESRRCKCGNPATKLCDWILPAALQPAISIEILSLKTCDEPLCATCTTSPAPNKDLCHRHAELWRTDPRNPQRELELKPSAPGSAISSTS